MSLGMFRAKVDTGNADKTDYVKRQVLRLTIQRLSARQFKTRQRNSWSSLVP
jgi:hypothetical protein